MQALEAAKATLTALHALHPDTPQVVPVGDGVLVEGRQTPGKVMCPLGSEYMVWKTVPEAVALIDRQMARRSAPKKPPAQPAQPPRPTPPPAQPAQPPPPPPRADPPTKKDGPTPAVLDELREPFTMDDERYERVVAGGPRVVAPPGECRRCGAKVAAAGGALLRCTQCKIARYCSRRCQGEDWRSHKPLCEAAVRVAQLRPVGRRDGPSAAEVWAQAGPRLAVLKEWGEEEAAAEAAKAALLLEEPVGAPPRRPLADGKPRVRFAEPVRSAEDARVAREVAAAVASSPPIADVVERAPGGQAAPAPAPAPARPMSRFKASMLRK